MPTVDYFNENGQITLPRRTDTGAVYLLDCKYKTLLCLYVATVKKFKLC